MKGIFALGALTGAAIALGVLLTANVILLRQAREETAQAVDVAHGAAFMAESQAAEVDGLAARVLAIESAEILVPDVAIIRPLYPPERVDR